MFIYTTDSNSSFLEKQTLNSSQDEERPHSDSHNLLLPSPIYKFLHHAGSGQDCKFRSTTKLRLSKKWTDPGECLSETSDASSLHIQGTAGRDRRKTSPSSILKNKSKFAFLAPEEKRGSEVRTSCVARDQQEMRQHLTPDSPPTQAEEPEVLSNRLAIFEATEEDNDSSAYDKTFLVVDFDHEFSLERRDSMDVRIQKELDWKDFSLRKSSDNLLSPTRRPNIFNTVVLANKSQPSQKH